MYKHGFDLTDFGKQWDTFSVLTGLVYMGQDEQNHFRWIDANGVLLVTCNNPETGQYYMPNHRSPERGYASYMGLEGDAISVGKLVQHIKQYAAFIKDESPGTRDFV